VSEGAWPIVSLGELIASIEAGASFRCRETPPETDEVGVAKVSAVSWGRYDENESKTCLNASRIDPSLLIQKGDFLISRANTVQLVGACVIAERVTKQVMLSDKTLRIQFTDSSLKPWVLHYLRSREGRNQIEALCTGNQESMRNISQKSIRQIQLPLAPAEERDRVVAYLDQQLSRLQASNEIFGTIQAKLKQARASILKAAVEGGVITSDADLARMIENQVQPTADMTPKDSVSDKTNRYGTLPRVPSGWSVSRISDLTSLVTSGSRGWSRFYSDEGAIFVRSQDINTYRLELQGVAKVSLPGSIEGSRTMIKQGDLLLIITGANVTVSARVECDVGEAYVSQHVALCRPREQITSAYLHLWLMAPGAGKSQLESSAYGAGKPGLNLENIRSISVLVPPLPEQYRIVAEVDRRFSVLDQVEAAVTASLARCGMLRQAILKRAFRQSAT
jgi:type I restriction enzyme S subunit